MSKEETILVIRDKDIDPKMCGINKCMYGCRTTPQERLDLEMTELGTMDKKLWFAPRQLVEEDESFRQLIPYVIIRKDDKILLYRRSKSNGDSRLRDLHSIGIGGHIILADCIPENQDDITNISCFQTVLGGLEREVSEEIGSQIMSTETNSSMIGFIRLNKPSPSVDNVHLGIVYVFDISSFEDGVDYDLESNDDDLSDFQFLTVDELEAAIGDDTYTLESWSIEALRIYREYLTVQSK